MSESNEEMKGNETKQDEPKREKVRVVDISLIKDFPDHPFQVKDDESMAQLVESIRMNGVLNPVIALKIDENHYQLISGHRRKHACILLGIDRIPLIGRELSKEEAIIEMVDSNLQREHILPSEKAKAYKMKMEAIKHKAGRHPKNGTVASPPTKDLQQFLQFFRKENQRQTQQNKSDQKSL